MLVELDPTLYYRITQSEEEKAKLRFQAKGNIFGAEQELARLIDDEQRRIEETIDSEGFEAVAASPGTLERFRQEWEREKTVYPLLRDSASSCFKRFPNSVTPFPIEPPMDELVLKTDDGTKITLGRRTHLPPYVGNPPVETFLISYDVAKWSVSITVGLEIYKKKGDKVTATADISTNKIPIFKKRPLKTLLASSLAAVLDTATPYQPSAPTVA